MTSTLHKKLLPLFLLPLLSFGQGIQNGVQTGVLDASASAWKFPTRLFANLPSAASSTGQRFTVTDCSTSACTAGSGTVRQDMVSTGSAWIPAISSDTAKCNISGCTFTGTIQGSGWSVTAAGAAAFTGPITITPIGGAAGMVAFPQGTANTPPANSVGFQAPTSVPSAFLFTLPSAPAAGIGRATNATPSVLSYAELSGDATTSGSNAVTVVKVNGNTPGNTCTNQFTRSIDSSARGTCASIANADLPNNGSAHAVAAVLVCAGTNSSTTAEVCNTSPTFTPVAGDSIIFQPITANTAAYTLNVNSLGAKAVTKRGTTALTANDIAASPYQVILTYDGTEWEMQGQGARPVAYTDTANIPLTALNPQAADTVVMNATGGSAVPTASAAPAGGTNGCSGSTDAAIYTAGTGWGCHQISGGGGTSIAYWALPGFGSALPLGGITNVTSVAGAVADQGVLMLVEIPITMTIGHVAVFQGVASTQAGAITGFALYTLNGSTKVYGVSGLATGANGAKSFAASATISPGAYYMLSCISNAGAVNATYLGLANVASFSGMIAPVTPLWLGTLNSACTSGVPNGTITPASISATTTSSVPIHILLP